MSIQVREQNLPGVGRRFEIDLHDGTTLVVVEERDGGRRVSVMHVDHDGPLVEVPLSVDQSAMIGALLLGARFSVVPSAPAVPDDDVLVETVTVTAGSLADGRIAATLPLFTADDDTALLAVISDETPELVEHPERPVAAGDRLVVAARRDRMAQVLAALTGA
jgi:TrkA domain protein